jgi:hypothetical protein
MRITYSAVALAAAALLAGCGEAASEGAGPHPTTSGASPIDTPSPEWTGEVIPDGTYVKTRTTADAKRLDIPKDAAAVLLGQDGEFHVELRIAGDAFAMLSDDGDEALSQGDGGTATYDADGNWVLTSDSTGCPGCVQTFAWSLKGDRLTLRMLDPTEAGDPLNVLLSRLVTDGAYTRR